MRRKLVRSAQWLWGLTLLFVIPVGGSVGLEKLDHRGFFDDAYKAPYVSVQTECERVVPMVEGGMAFCADADLDTSNIEDVRDNL